MHHIASNRTHKNSELTHTHFYAFLEQEFCYESKCVSNGRLDFAEIIPKPFILDLVTQVKI